MTLSRLASCLVAALAAFALPLAALAQGAPERGQDGGGGSRSEISPYIEVAQVLTKEIDPGNDVFTYTRLAAGVDASVTGRNSAASVSLRYERRVAYDDDIPDGDTISGIARGSLGVTQGLTLEAGALASRTAVQNNGALAQGAFVPDDDSTTEIYSGYVGPSLQTEVGDLQVEGHYRFGYTRVETPDVVTFTPGAQPSDLVDESTTHVAQARVGIAPNTLAPVGVGIGGGWTEQNISNLDQRVRDRYVRADAIAPVSPNVALVGGIGYEDVEVSSRDAVRDTDGNPVIGPDGRYVTDDSAPRQIAFQTDGIIWDVGVMWRPSRRTSLEAHYGRRYGSSTYYGTFSYAPDSRSSLNVSVYDGLTSFGGALTNQLAGLPASFDAFRNPFTGEIGGCVASTEDGNCIGGALSSGRSTAYRGRGAAVSYSVKLGRTQAGVAGGYDRRKFIAAPGTAFASANGIVDESYWVAIYSNTRLDERSSLSANAYASLFDGGFALDGDGTTYSASLAYYRNLLGGLSGTAAVGLDGVNHDNLPDYMSASALLGLRYGF